MNITDYFLTKENFDIKETNVKGILKTTPLPEDLSPYYESADYISHYQDSGSLKEKIYKFAQNFNLNYKRNILAKELPLAAKILDYGCGAGEFLKYVSKDFSVVGYEPNLNARIVAENKIGKEKIIKNLDELPDENLEAITLWHVLEHIDNQEVILNKFYNKLKDNGLLFIAVPNHTSYDAKYYKEFWAAWDVPRHVYHFSKNGMKELFNSNQWKLEKIKPLILDSFYISILSEKYKKNPFFWLKGMIIGAISNIKASKNEEFSSLIYIIRKK